MRGRIAAVLAALLLLAAGGAMLMRPGEAVEVTIPPGLSAAQAATVLVEKGVIRSRFLFRAAAKLWGLDRRLMPGNYRLRERMPLPLLMRTLGAGALGLKAAIPEGFSAWQIAERLDALGVCDERDFLNYVRVKRLEGYMFPTTYYFEPSSGAEKAAERMAAEFKRRLEPEYLAAAGRPNLTLQQTLTLASIVEREAVLSSEKPLIAAVYLNRMRLRMRLQADPTVQYALGRWKKGLTKSDLRVESPYNTYIHYGLPPGPICNPGLGSFRAALRPAKTDAIFFVADNKGGHVFSATLDEHLTAQRAFKRGLREIKARLKREGRGE